MEKLIKVKVNDTEHELSVEPSHVISTHDT